MELSLVEEKVLAVIAVAGNVNRQEFNTLCNTADIHQSARERGLEGLREKEVVGKHAMRYAGDSYDNYVCIEPVQGLVLVRDGGFTNPKIEVDTHPLNIR